MFGPGGDLQQTSDGANADPLSCPHRPGIFHDTARQIVTGPKPVVAAVEGYACGAGRSLAAACDSAVAA